MSVVDTLLLFAIMAALAALPSTSVALVVARSATAGFSHGCAVSAGIVLGDLVYVVLAVLGMVALAEIMGPLFVVVRYLCGFYLLWLGWTLLRSSPDGEPGVHLVRKTHWLADFTAGFLVTLSDIKAIVFYASLFPTFVPLGELGVIELGFLVVITIVAVGGVKLGYAYSAHRLGHLTNGSRWQTPARRLAGAGMLGAGGWLLIKT